MSEIAHVELPVTLVRCQRCGSKEHELEARMLPTGEMTRYCAPCQVMYHSREEKKR